MGCMLPADFNFREPDYTPIYIERQRRLLWLREDPARVEQLKAYYRTNVAQMIIDWGFTVDPRNVELGRPATVPFILFDAQIEWVDSVIADWHASRSGITEKSRDMGVSWMAIAVACCLCTLYDGMSVGFGSRKEEYVDRVGDPKSLLWKARQFMMHLPVEFRAGFTMRHAPHMRLEFPNTGATIVGECGDGIGRGDRKGIYFVDESAHLERARLIEASLMATSNCRQDISSVNGMDNPFAEKVHSGKYDVKILDWHDDPRKDDAWYLRVCDMYDPITIAQEVDRNYNASVEGIVIPGEWVQAAVDAHIKLGIIPTGIRKGAFDPADEGKDKNAFLARHGVLVDFAQSWSGKGLNIYQSTEKAFDFCDVWGLPGFDFDSDGLGAGVRGDAEQINKGRARLLQSQKTVAPYRGSASVWEPQGEMVKGRTNEDYFQNFKAQAWWHLRMLFQNTYRAVVLKLPYDATKIISIDSTLKEKLKLMGELSQATYKKNDAGKMVINKKPEGSPSPNLADGVVILFAPGNRPMKIDSGVLARAKAIRG
jgi:phage terminase large subunit